MVLVVAAADIAVNQQGVSSSRVQVNPPTIQGIQVFDSANPSQLLTAIDWGTLSPGQTATHDALITDDDPSKTYTVTFTTSEWEPANATYYMAFSYQVYGESLETQLAVRFILEIYENATDLIDFSFTITLNFEETSSP